VGKVSEFCRSISSELLLIRIRSDQYVRTAKFLRQYAILCVEGMALPFVASIAAMIMHQAGPGQVSFIKVSFSPVSRSHALSPNPVEYRCERHLADAQAGSRLAILLVTQVRLSAHSTAGSIVSPADDALRNFQPRHV
jgi:hypothetical protein